MASFMVLYPSKCLELCCSASERRIAKPLYGQKLYPGFESLPLRQVFSLTCPRSRALVCGVGGIASLPAALKFER